MDEHYFNNKNRKCFSRHLLSIFYKIDNINKIMDEICCEILK